MLIFSNGDNPLKLINRLPLYAQLRIIALNILKLQIHLFKVYRSDIQRRGAHRILLEAIKNIH